jgi:hypothetical protein
MSSPEPGRFVFAPSPARRFRRVGWVIGAAGAAATVAVLLGLALRRRESAAPGPIRSATTTKSHETTVTAPSATHDVVGLSAKVFFLTWPSI